MANVPSTAWRKKISRKQHTQKMKNFNKDDHPAASSQPAPAVSEQQAIPFEHSGSGGHGAEDEGQVVEEENSIATGNPKLLTVL
jgi:hypothetical protein